MCSYFAGSHVRSTCSCRWFYLWSWDYRRMARWW